MRRAPWVSLIVLGAVLTVSEGAFAQTKPPPKYPPIKPPAATPAPPEPAEEPEQPDPEGETPPAKPPPKAASAQPPAAQPKAKEESVMADNTKEMWLALGFGPSVGILGCVRRLCNLEQAYTQFKISEDFGYHVSGSDGLAVGANLQQAFNSNFFRGIAAFKMWWDAPISDELTLYLTPMLQVGYALSYFGFGELGSIVDHAFNTQAGLGIRMVLLDSAIVYVRPITADVNISEDGVALFYDIAVGGGFTFTP